MKIMLLINHNMEWVSILWFFLKIKVIYYYIIKLLIVNILE